MCAWYWITGRTSYKSRDIDSDWSGETKDRIYDYLKEKYGSDRVLHVGTFSRLGLKSSLKDLARVYGIGPVEEINKMNSAIPADIESWEEVTEFFKENKKDVYAFYLKHKSVFDLLPNFINKIRQVGKHAGGIVILDKPIYEYAPVERVQGEVVTAYEESGQKAILDEIGIIKLDILGISVLEVIKSTIEQIEEKLYLIEDDDGIKKVVPYSYIIEHGGKIEK